MRQLVAAMLLAGWAPTAQGADADAADRGVRLSVKPLLCIIDERVPACDMRFLIAWRSAEEGDYCLFSQFAPEARRCWTTADSGQHEEQRLVDRPFRYWLALPGSGEPLATVSVEVMKADTSDRRRRRRGRHVWDIL